MKKSVLVVFLLGFLIFVSLVNAFTFQIETSVPNENFSVQADNAINLTLNCGEGNSSVFSGTGLVNCTYITPGIYNLSLSGQASRISFYEGTEDLLIDVLSPLSQNLSGINNTYQMFYSAENITSFTASDFLDAVSSNITYMREMFREATNFNQNLTGWNTSSVTDMRDMFYSATSFNGNISNWETSSLRDVEGIFFYASSFNQDLNSWDISNCYNIQAMFRGASSFNQDLNDWDTSSVTIISNIFMSAGAFNGNISTWDLSNVSQPFGLLQGAGAFNQDISNWNTSSFTKMEYFFDLAYTFNQNISGWDTSKVTDMNYMFRMATAFNQDISNWNTSKVTDTNHMFYYADSFNQDISNWDVSNVTDMSFMFTYATSFNQNLSRWNVSSVTDMKSMFNDSGLSTANYDSLLLGWSNLSMLQNNTILDLGTTKYTSAAQSARNNLTSNYNWTINDGGLYSPAPSPTPTPTPSSGGGGGGGGGAPISSFWTRTYLIQNEQFKQGNTKSLAAKERVEFRINEDLHHLGVTELTANTAKVNISSDPISVILYVGDLKKYDLTNNGYYDLQVSLDLIEDLKANITIKSINEQINQKPTIDQPSDQTTNTENQQQEPQYKNENNKKSGIILYTILIGLLLAIVVFFVYTKYINRRAGRAIKYKLQKYFYKLKKKFK